MAGENTFRTLDEQTEKNTFRKVEAPSPAFEFDYGGGARTAEGRPATQLYSEQPGPVNKFKTLAGPVDEAIEDSERELYERRANLLKQMLDQRRTEKGGRVIGATRFGPADVEPAELTVADEIEVQELRDKELPLPRNLREREILWGHERDVYNQWTGEGTAYKSWTTAYGGIYRGSLTVAGGMAYLAKLGTKMSMGGFGSGPIDNAYNEIDRFNTRLKELAPSPDFLTLDPNTGKSNVTLGYKYLNMLSEATPSILLSIGIGMLGGGMTRAAAMARGLTAETAAELGTVTTQKVSAATFAALGAQGRHDLVLQDGIQRKLPRAEAEMKADIAAAAGIIPDFFINMNFNPVSLALGGTTPTQTFLGQALASVGQEAIEGGSSQALTEGLEYVEGVKSILRKQPDGGYQVDWKELEGSVMNTIVAGRDEAILGIPIGLAIHGIHKINEPEVDHVKRMRELIKDVTNKDLDVADRSHAFKVFIREFGQERAHATMATEMIDRLFKVGAQNDGISLDSAWGTFYARFSERLSEQAEKTGVLFASADESEIAYKELRSAILDPKRFPAGEEMSAQKALGTITNTPGVRKEALRWTRLGAMLEKLHEAGGTTNRTELLNYLDRNEVRLQTVMKKKDQPPKNVDEFEEIFRKYEQAEQEHGKTSQEFDRAQESGDNKKIAAAISNMEAAREKYNTARTAYLDASRQSQDQTRYAFVSPSGPRGKYEEWVMRWVQPMEELLVTKMSPEDRRKQPSDALGSKGMTEPTKFSTARWDEKNPLLHIRVDERFDPDTGKAYLNVIEIQSDWHQEGAEKGYETPEAEAAREAADAEYRVVSKEIGELVQEKNIVREQMRSSKGEENKTLYQRRIEIEKRLDILKPMAIRLKNESIVEGPPEAPFRNTWQDLALKKVLLEAVARGYERISWQPGFMQDKFQGASEPGRAKFYDVGLVQRMTDILRKLVGKNHPDAVVGQVKMDVSGPHHNLDDAFGNVPEAPVGTTVDIHSVSITPAIQEAVMGGKVFYSERLDSAWLRESMSEQGKTPSRVFNDVDMARAGMAELLANDPITKWIKANQPELHERALKGDLSAKEIQDVVVKMRAVSKEYYAAGDFFAGVPLSARASFTLMQSGRAYIRGLANPTFADAIHEIMHYVPFMMLHGSDVDLFEKYAGKPLAEWGPEEHEKAVQWMMGALSKGYSPDPTMASVFQAVGKQIKAAFPKMTTEQKRGMSSEMQFAVQRLFQRDTDPIAYVKENILSLEEDIETLSKAANALQKKEIKSVEATGAHTGDLGSYLEIKAQVTQFQNMLRQQQAMLKRLHESQFVDGAELFQHERANAVDQYNSDEARLDPAEYIRRNISLLDDFRVYVEHIARPIMGLPSGRKVLDFLNMATSDMKNQLGKMSELMREGINSLTAEDRNWLSSGAKLADLPLGWEYTNHHLLLEGRMSPIGGQLAPPTKTIEAHMLAQQAADQEGQRKAVAMNMVREMPLKTQTQAGKELGDRVFLKETFESYFKRMWHNQAIERFQLDQPWVNRLVDALASRSLNQGITKENMKKWFTEVKDAWRGTGPEALTRLRGALEFSRIIPDMPTIFEGTKLFHTDPATYMRATIFGEARRLATVKYFGQGVLQNYHLNERGLKSVLRLFGVHTTFTKPELIQRLFETGNYDVDYLNDLNVRDLARMSQNLGKPIGKTPEDMWNALQALTVDDLRPKSPLSNPELLLRKVGTRIGGVNTKAPLQTVLTEIKTRYSAQIEDQVYEKLRSKYIEEGGNVSQLDRVWRAFQGYPMWLPESRGARLAFEATDFALSSIQSAMTSLSAIWNLPQTIENMTHLVGGMNVAKAFVKILQNFGKQKKAALKLGVFNEVLRTYGQDDSRFFVKAKKIVRELAGKFLLIDSVTELQNVWSATAARIYTDEIKNAYAPTDLPRKLDPDHEVFLKQMRLTAGELEQVAQGKMTDALYAKVVQNSVSVSQHVTEDPQYRAIVEEHPFWKMVAPLNSYTFGQGRLWSNVLGEMRTGSPAKRISASKSLLVLIGTSLGTAVLMQMLRNKLYGLPATPEDDEYWKFGAKALFNSSVARPLGFAGSPFQYNNTGIGVVGNATPAFSIISSLAQLAMDNLTSEPTGRYARFPLSRQLKEETLKRFPAIRVPLRQLDLINNPMLKTYEDARRAVNKWEKATHPKGYSEPTAPINPDLEPIWAAAIRGNAEEAWQESNKLKERMVMEGKDYKLVRESIMRSLSNHRPINLTNERFNAFMQTLSPQKQTEFLHAQEQYNAIANMVAG